MPAIAPDGTVYVTWERGWLFPVTGSNQTPQIVISKSTDGGTTWSPRTLVSDICSGALFPPAGYNRETTNDFPRIAVAQSGPHRGRIYVVYQDCRISNGGAQGDPSAGLYGHPDTDIYLSFSDDGGTLWSTPTLVAGGGDGKIQFWPTVSLQPSGNVDITFYESEELDLEPENDDECVVPLGGGGGPPFRIEPVSSLVDLFYAQSTDGGSTFHSPLRVSDATTNWCTTATNIVPNFGDYNTAVSGGNRLYATWADGRNGIPDVFFSKIQTIGKAER